MLPFNEDENDELPAMDRSFESERVGADDFHHALQRDYVYLEIPSCVH